MNKRQKEKFIRKFGCKKYPSKYHKVLAHKILRDIDKGCRISPLFFDISELLYYNNDKITSKHDNILCVASYLRFYSNKENLSKSYYNELARLEKL